MECVRGATGGWPPPEGAGSRGVSAEYGALSEEKGGAIREAAISRRSSPDRNGAKRATAEAATEPNPDAGGGRGGEPRRRRGGKRLSTLFIS
jgi:hypothetical protein